MPKTRNISFSYTEYTSADEMAPSDRELVVSSREIAMNAYAPYSNFKVGSAVRLQSGRVVTGTNVENAAFPSGICAERTALSNAISNFPGDRPVAIAVSAVTPSGPTGDQVSPCGLCRQFIAEEELRNGKKIRIILSGKDKILVIDSISDLLPLQFNKDDLRTVLP
ncbi:MAG TPA: cytidine deaminase [Bacteroidales bacterium]|jgi:cytidine deaminase|nr:cytidine deaminase [Bacteroidales bacterium]